MLVPTQWNQSKPEPAEMIGCACGMNMSCPICGWGRGASPCKCSTVKESLGRSLEQNRDIWEILADCDTSGNII